MRIGFAGLGPMGSAMALRLVRAGHEMRVWNRTPERAAPLVEAGAVQAASPAEAARGAEFVVSSLADDAASEAVTLGEDGLASGMAAGAAHLAMSTLSVALADRLAAAHAGRGQGFLATPVLGRPPAAAAGALFIMAAGDAALVERARPVLDAMGQRVFVVGAVPRQASLVKLACNFLIFSTIEQLSEVFALSEKGGVAPAVLFEVLTESLFTAPVHKNYGRMILERAFDPPGGTVALGAKDTRLVLAAGEELGVPLPLASLLRDRFVAAGARGEGGLDFTVIARQVLEAAGLGGSKQG